MTSYLENTAAVTEQLWIGEGVKFVARKCGCGSNWCEVCSRRTTLPAMGRALAKMNWRKVRHVVLTVDRKLFEDGREAWEKCKGRVRQLIRDLDRIGGVVIEDWLSALQWHKDGFPHWHLILQVEKEGSLGMIGYEKILSLWKMGGVREKYIQGEKHWRNMAGYFGTHGYFEGNGEQGKLPAWALLEKRIIRRFSQKQKNEKWRWVEKDGVKKETVRKKSERLSYGQILASCGMSTDLLCMIDGAEVKRWRLKLPYAEVRKLEGEYEVGVGFVLELPWAEVRDLIKESAEVWDPALFGSPVDESTEFDEDIPF